MEMGARYLNQKVKVLFEEESEGFWQGYTDHYLRVKVKSDRDLHNRIEPVTVQEVCGEWVLGSLNDLVQIDFYLNLVSGAM